MCLSLKYNNVIKKIKKYSNNLKDTRYNLDEKILENIIDFHYKFEKIHPFQDGNGRVGRIIAFKECLKNNIVPFIILDKYKVFYYCFDQNGNVGSASFIITVS